MQSINSTMEMLKQSNNPMGFLQGMAAMNPKMKPILDDISASGGDPRAAFFAAAQRKGVDPNTILNTMQQYGYKQPN